MKTLYMDLHDSSYYDYQGIPCTCALSNLEGGTMQGCVCCTSLMRSNQAKTLSVAIVKHSEVLHDMYALLQCMN